MPIADTAKHARRLRLAALLAGVAALLLVVSGVLGGSGYAYFTAAMLALSGLVNLWAASKMQRQ